ncbi:MAG: M48 family metallopeptidase [Planctomycetes bacterium]|nr:M48 family metallopeptidase [Planctomycetota bacterium]
MAFFENQARARRSTLLLVALFVLAVIIIVAVLNFAIIGGIIISEDGGGSTYPDEQPARPAGGWDLWWRPEAIMIISGITLGIIFFGCLFKMLSLSDGGSAVAKMLGCVKVSPGTKDLGERKLINVVEEMSIASGIPVPGIYVMEEDSINAFAAGLNTSNAVVAVTRGAMKKLNREELQGVIAHEFSHILNSDMRLNIRLMGILYGILLIALIGYGIVRIIGQGRIRIKGKGGAVIIGIFLVGLVMMIVGYIGLFFARLIQSAVSRQREYLADASAVQFTRNSAGIVGALKKIGGLTGSKIGANSAQEAAHLFFGDALSRLTGSLMATHPPLEKRIKALDPTFSGKFSEITPDAEDTDYQSPISHLQAVSSGKGMDGWRMKVKPGDITGRMGTLDKQQIAYAAMVRAQIPAEISQAVHSPAGAQAVIACMLLEKEGQLRATQLDHLGHEISSDVREQAENLSPLVESMPPAARLPAVSMALPALRELDAAAADKYKAALKFIIESDKQVTLFEYLLYRIVGQAFLTARQSSQADKSKYYSLAPLWPGAVAIMGAVACAGEKDPTEAAEAFQHGMSWLSTDAQQASPQMPSLGKLDEALNLWSQASPGLKKRLIGACTACAAADGIIQVQEAELLRAVACVLHCPMPPILESAA